MFLGIDITEVNRVAYLVNQYENRFLNKFFSKEEIQYCYRKQHPYIHFSGIFSAKESIKKALLSSSFFKTVSFSTIEIKHYKNGAPYAHIKNFSSSVKSISISISHTKEYATSIAILNSK